MNILRRTVMAIGGMAVVALVIALAAPKAAHGIVATAVQVVNTATSPALTSSVDDPGRTAYQSTLSTPDCFSGCTFEFPTIPTGHRVVIQHISGFATLGGPVPGVTVIVHGSTTPILGAFFDPVSGTTSAFDQPVLFYFDAGQNPAVEFQIQPSTFPVPFGTNTVTITGYELTCSVATPCAAIAQ